MRILVTGAPGFIGSRVCRFLLSSGHQVAAVARPASRVERLGVDADAVHWIRGDLSEIAAWRDELAAWAPEACLHLAWYAEPGKYLQSPLNVTALKDSLSLLETLGDIGCRRVVMVGTCAEYDTKAELLHEDSPVRPLTLYAAAKLSLCLVGEQMAARAGIDFAWARLFYLYGPEEDERRALPALIRSLLSDRPFAATDGAQIRDYLHVDDIARALVLLVERRCAGVFNVSSGVPVSMREVMEIVGDITDRGALIRFGSLPYRDWEPKFICGDSGRLRSLGWAPRYDLKTGISEVVDWWRRKLQSTNGVDR